MKPLSQLVRPNILALQPYSTARDEYAGGGIDVWLDANESPYDNGVNRYPDPHQRALKALIAELKDVDAGRIFLGNGSDEAIDLAFRIFCRPGLDNAVSIAPTYGMYRVAAATNDVQMREVPLGAGYSLPVGALLAAADERTKLIWLCSPNNPTGNAFPAQEIESLLRRFDGIVVLDEAYIDFADGGGFLPRLGEFPNLIVLQTLSKAWGMAGLRLGLAFASEEIAGLFGRVKYPYNINTLTQRAVAESLRRDISAQVAAIRAERSRLAAALAACPCIGQVYPSEGNFLLVKTAAPDPLYRELVAAGSSSATVRGSQVAKAACASRSGARRRTTACWKPSKISAHEKSALHRPRRHRDRGAARGLPGRQPRKAGIHTRCDLGAPDAPGAGFRAGDGDEPGRAGHGGLPGGGFPAAARKCCARSQAKASRSTTCSSTARSKATMPRRANPVRACSAATRTGRTTSGRATSSATGRPTSCWRATSGRRASFWRLPPKDAGCCGKRARKRHACSSRTRGPRSRNTSAAGNGGSS